MSRNYNITNRMLKAYEKYVTDFQKRTTAWVKKGFTPKTTVALSYEDYVANRQLLKTGKHPVAAGNITRVIISKQLYEFNQTQAEALVAELKAKSIETLGGQKITVERIKAGLGRAALSELNNILKAEGKSGYERAQYITEHVYEDSL